MSIESRRHQYGKVFGHWQIKEFLGRGSGGKSAVFRLEHTESVGVESALKVISLIEERGRIDELAPSRRAEYESARRHCTEQAEREVLLMNDLQGNTNIVDYLDHTFVDWSDETGFGRDMLIRMEKLSDLRGQISTGKKYDRDEVLKVGVDICTALILCHKKGILHRDIKPENIFINKNGNYKLGDFGISRIVNTASSAVASTGIGTPQYWAPEQTSGKYDARVDIYSLGLVLYELANQNRLPFAESSYVQEKDIHRRLLGEALPLPCGADRSFGQIILKACAFRAEDRYQTAEELLHALQELCINTAAPLGDIYATHLASEAKGYYSTMPASSATDSNAYGTMPAGNAGSGVSNPPTKGGTAKQKKRLPALIVIAVIFAAVLFLNPFGCKEHDWSDATCSSPRKCRECGETEGDPLEHVWNEATCTTGNVCIYCGEEISAALGHQWVDATYTAPQTCTVCGTTTGVKLQVQPVYINELSYQSKYGKVYYHDNQYANYDNNKDWRDLYTPGHIQQPVCDGYGNVFTYGIHMDGDQLGPYYITYDLDSKYTMFSGWCVLPDYKAGTSDAKYYSKYFEIYCDGKLVFTSNTMRNGSMSQYFEIDVTAVDVLTIQYAATTGPNDLAVLCDGMLS